MMPDRPEAQATGADQQTRSRFEAKRRGAYSLMPMATSQFDLVLLMLRLVAGPTIFWHGYNKFFRGGKLAGTARWFDSMGMKPNGVFHAWAAASTETVCGVLLTLGLLSPFAAAGVIGVMFVAAVTSHRHAFLITKDGIEYVFVLATLCFAIGAFGAGRWSLDNVFGFYDGPGKFLDTEWLGFGIALGLGLLSGIGLLVACYRPPAKES